MCRDGERKWNIQAVYAANKIVSLSNTEKGNRKPGLCRLERGMVNDAKDLVIARMQSQDLGAALVIQSEVYPSFLIENTRAFASRLAIANSYCLTAKCGGTMVAYLIAYGRKTI